MVGITTTMATVTTVAEADAARDPQALRSLRQSGRNRTERVNDQTRGERKGMARR